MIHVTYVRRGLIVVAYSVNGDAVYLGVGFTERWALKHLLNSIESDDFVTRDELEEMFVEARESWTDGTTAFDHRFPTMYDYAEEFRLVVK